MPAALKHMEIAPYYWFDGKLSRREEVSIDPFAHALHYGSGVFEGIRAYATPRGPGIFRLREHMQRLINSARIYRMELPFSVDEFSSVACELVRLNKMGACYVKPIVLRGYGEVGVNPLSSPIDDETGHDLGQPGQLVRGVVVVRRRPHHPGRAVAAQVEPGRWLVGHRHVDPDGPGRFRPLLFGQVGADPAGQ